MIATTTTEISFADSVAAHSLRRRHRARLKTEAARGLEKLGHAIEYLCHQFIDDGVPNNNSRNQLDAIEVLMALHRGIHADAPQCPTVFERFKVGLEQFTA